jgi:hypothetical protein
VQRIESTGAASFETTKALASVFELDLATLAAPARSVRRRPAWIAIAASLVAGLCGLFIAQRVRADQVMLDVVLSLNSKPLSQTQRLIVAENDDAEIRLEGQMRVVIVPAITKEGSVLLSLRVDEFSKSAGPENTDWVRVGDPKVVAFDNDVATVSITSPGGNVIRIGIRPHRI